MCEEPLTLPVGDVAGPAVMMHRRIQDFVRGGGGQGPLGPRGGGKALLARASLFGGAIFCGEGRGAKAPLAPPQDPRM